MASRRGQLRRLVADASGTARWEGFPEACCRAGRGGWDTVEEDVPNSTSRRYIEVHELVGSETDIRHVPLMDSLGISELPPVRLPGVNITIGVVVSAANTLYFSDYEVTFNIHRTTTVEVIRKHTLLRSQSTGAVTYLGPQETRRQVGAVYQTTVSRSRYVGLSGVGTVNFRKITQPSCIAYGARC